MNAENTCYNDVEGPLSSVADFDIYDIRVLSSDPNLPETYVTYLQSAAVVKAIGAAGGTFKTVGNLSWLRVFGAGHEVPFYQPALSLQAFKQTVMKKAIFSA